MCYVCMCLCMWLVPVFAQRPQYMYYNNYYYFIVPCMCNEATLGICCTASILDVVLVN